MGEVIDGVLATFSTLFSGNTSFYGVHKYRAARPGEKAEGQSWTKISPVTEKNYADHINGLTGLGISPIKEDSTCAFGAIDVDIYDKDDQIKNIVSNIYKWNLPMLPFRSKSGGLHLYLFLEPDNKTGKLPTGSETIRVLSQLSSLLSISGQEIFPKQSTWRPGRQGNWINLPYFNMDSSQQYLFSKESRRTTFHDAIKIIQSKRTSLVKLQSDLEALPFGDGPPCLQQLMLNGGPEEGGRNVFLFNAAIYTKEKDHTSYDVLLDDVNDSIVHALDEQELTTIKKSVIKKEYTYECSKQPLCDVCNKDLCATRKFGIGRNNGLFMGVSLGQLTIHRGRGVSYSWIVELSNTPVTIHFDSPRDFRNQDVFIDQVLAELNYKASRIKAEKWDKILNEALSTAVEDEPELSDENTVQGRLTKMVLDFIIKYVTNNKIDLERGFAYLDTKKGNVLFKSDDLWKFLVDNNKQRNLKSTLFQQVLKSMTVTSPTTRIGSKVLRVKSIRISEIENLIGGALEPLQDIDFESERSNEDY